MGLLLNLINQFTQPGQLSALANGKASAEGGDVSQFDALFSQILSDQTATPTLSAQTGLLLSTASNNAQLQDTPDDDGSEDPTPGMEMDSNAMSNFNALVTMQTPLPLQQVIMPVAVPTTTDAPPAEAIAIDEAPLVQATMPNTTPAPKFSPQIPAFAVKETIHPMSMPGAEPPQKTELVSEAFAPAPESIKTDATPQAKILEAPKETIAASFDQRVMATAQKADATSTQKPTEKITKPGYVPPFITEETVQTQGKIELPATQGISTEVHALIDQVAPWMMPQPLTRSDVPPSNLPQEHVPPFIKEDTPVQINAQATVQQTMPDASTASPAPIRVSQGMMLPISKPEEITEPQAIDDPDIFTVAVNTQAVSTDKTKTEKLDLGAKLPEMVSLGIESIKIETAPQQDQSKQDSQFETFVPTPQKTTEHGHSKPAEKHPAEFDLNTTATSAPIQPSPSIHIQHNASMDAGVNDKMMIQPVISGPAQSMPDLPMAKPIESHSLFHSSAMDTVDQVADGAISAMKTNRSEITMQLRPEHLGQVTINLSSNRNQEVSARIVAFSSEAHQVLSEQAQSLKQSLENQGIQVDRISVSLASGHVSQADSMQNNTGFQQGGQFDSNPDANRQTTQHGFQHQQQSQQAQTFFQQFQQQQSNPNAFQQARTSGHTHQGQDLSGFASEPSSSVDRVRNDNGNVSILA